MKVFSSLLSVRPNSRRVPEAVSLLSAASCVQMSHDESWLKCVLYKCDLCEFSECLSAVEILLKFSYCCTCMSVQIC